MKTLSIMALFAIIAVSPIASQSILDIQLEGWTPMRFAGLAYPLGSGSEFSASGIGIEWYAFHHIIYHIRTNVVWSGGDGVPALGLMAEGGLSFAIASEEWKIKGGGFAMMHGIEARARYHFINFDGKAKISAGYVHTGFFRDLMFFGGYRFDLMGNRPDRQVPEEFLANLLNAHLGFFADAIVGLKDRQDTIAGQGTFTTTGLAYGALFGFRFTWCGFSCYLGMGPYDNELYFEASLGLGLVL